MVMNILKKRLQVRRTYICEAEQPQQDMEFREKEAKKIKP